MSFLDHATSLQPELVALRRSLHAHPEVGNDLPWTQQRIVEALDGLDLEVTLGRSVSSVVAVLRGARPGPTVLLRGDMDGLPVAEQTGLEYASTTGTMHACGHDLHMAGLVGAAHLLSARRDELAGSVVFMFQPGEEGPGGAKPMIEEGLLEVTGEKPVAAYGIHVFPGERGLFTYRPGTAMAGANYLHVTFHGEGGHGSQPHTAKDPVPALLEFGTALQTMITRRFSVFDPVVASITQLSAGEAINVIPDRASLGASVRTLSAASDEAFPAAVRELAHGIAAAHGVRAEVEWTVLYPLTRNDDAETAFVAGTLAELVGEDCVRLDADPLMVSEDFSFVLQEVPGCFFFLECSPPELAQESPGWNHSPTVLFDDAVLGTQAAALAELAWRRLQRD
ncbi:M20 metallopeptidase family protein [Kocuria rhizophila]|uniref:M20 metallopeptidase family protein n=1 Tax=Kocuria rhizophila TaxID=72000 RepID=UPI0021A946A3|nr:M20 family metallopeptidase [Kocuria rhizophila]MCT1544971.1 M20 family metallopeptidase [Kocuria rhizophila]